MIVIFVVVGRQLGLEVDGRLGMFSQVEKFKG